jgi:hypothetical protein
MLGAEYVPPDGDPEFERVAGLFCEPSRELLEHGNPGYFEREDNQGFYAIFAWLCNMLEADATESAYVFKAFLNLIMVQIMVMANPKRKFINMLRSNVPYNIPQLNFRGKISGDEMFVGWNQEEGSISVPLIILSVIKDPSHSGIVRFEVPKALLSVTIAFAQNSGLDYYDGFVIFLDGTSLHISRARVSAKYMQDLFEHRIINDDMLFYRSKSFDLLDVDGRRESTRFIFSLFRYLSDSEQWAIPGNYGS